MRFVDVDGAAEVFFLVKSKNEPVFMAITLVYISLDWNNTKY